MKTPSIGLLPLYLELYDRAMPEIRESVERFIPLIQAGLEAKGVQVTAAPVCRLAAEVNSAVRQLESAAVDAVVTLHLAYSPSLEAVDALAATPLPLLVLDTTPDYAFGPLQDPDAIMFNHGIHGVQDLCNLLRRRGKPFQIEVGHWQRSDVLARIAERARGAALAAALRHSRVGRIGQAFAAMGDFVVAPETLRALGVEQVPCTPETLSAHLASVTDEAVAAEMAADRERFHVGELDAEAYRQTTRASLAVRRWLEAERLTAFTVNFLEVDRASGLPAAPFLEASKALARGAGYAGEGDVLTAALVGAILSLYPDTSFVEMFCPDWEGNRVFISHMGEMNVALAAEKPLLLQQPFPWTDAADPVTAAGCYRGGDAVWVDLAPGPGDSFTLILAPVVVDAEGEASRLAESVRGWIRPRQALADFLAAYSRAGGTHHAALVYGTPLTALAGFGACMGWDVTVL